MMTIETQIANSTETQNTKSTLTGAPPAASDQTLNSDKTFLPLDLSRISDKEILFRLEVLTRKERKITYIILCHINEAESRKLYFQLGYDSIYKYLNQHLHYSEREAYARMQAARVLKIAPSISVKIENGDLNLSQLVKVEQTLKEEKKQGQYVEPTKTLDILKQIENKSVFETKKILAVEFNQPLKLEPQIKPQKDKSVRLEMTLTEEQFQILEKVRDLLSHAVPNRDVTDVLIHLAKAHIKKVEGRPAKGRPAETRSAKKCSTERVPLDRGIDKPTQVRQQKKTPKSSTQRFDSESPSESQSELLIEKPVSSNNLKAKPNRQKRKYISIHTKRSLMKDADHACQYQQDGKDAKCGSTYQLQIDHITPIAKGGMNHKSNLRILCGTHNRYEAKKWDL